MIDKCFIEIKTQRGTVKMKTVPFLTKEMFTWSLKEFPITLLS